MQAAAASAAATAAASSLPPQQLEATKKAAKQFEGIFISEMMSHMFEGTAADPEFGGSTGEDMFHGLLVQEYGKQMAQGKGIGIADQLQKMMIQMQERKG